jgi:hypothetical protein
MLSPGTKHYGILLGPDGAQWPDGLSALGDPGPKTFKIPLKLVYTLADKTRKLVKKLAISHKSGWYSHIFPL